MRRRKPKGTVTMYMHTIAERPATFDGTDYLYYASQHNAATIVRSLSTLRRQQEKDNDRIRREYSEARAENDAARYGYVLVYVPIGKR